MRVPAIQRERGGLGMFCAFVFCYKPFGEISELQSDSMEEKASVLILLLLLQ